MVVKQSCHDLPSSIPMTKIKRSHTQNQKTASDPSPSHFFVGRQRDPPYAWAYDDDEMRKSNIMWLVEEIIDADELERMYLEEIKLSFMSRVIGVERRDVDRTRVKKRKGNDGGIIDMSVSDDDQVGDVGDGAMIATDGSGSLSIPLPFTHPRRSAGKHSTPSSLSAYSATTATNSMCSSPVQKKVAYITRDEMRRPEMRAVFVSSTL